MIHRIALGTVQFGLDYGINNDSGQVRKDEIISILDLCSKVGINTLDTAFAYGDSEIRLGKINTDKFEIISKLPTCNASLVDSCFNKSLNNLNRDRLYGYMLHNYSTYTEDKNVWKELCKLKEENKVEKIGVSLYSPEELKSLWNDNIDLDIIQIPYNLFDRRFESIMPKIKDKNIEIHSRSTFLQGLFFKTPEDLPKHFTKIKWKIEKLHQLSLSSSLSIADLSLGFCLNNPYLDKVVLGVDSTEQLLANIESVTKNKDQNFDWKILDFLKEDDINIINPSMWKI